MRKVIYQRLIIEGFQSYANPTVFPIPQGVGVTLLRGDNGVGKSTLFNALLWAEYGYNLKDSVATWEDLRPEGFRGTRVVVERSDGEYDYMVARHVSFKGTTKGLTGGDKLMIFKKRVDEEKFTSDHLMGEGLHKVDMQEIIQQQIGVDVKTYVNSILFGQRVASMVEMKDAEKRKLFEELFNVDFVDGAKEKAKERSAKLDSEISTMEMQIQNDTKSMASQHEFLVSQTEILREFQQTHAERVEEAAKRLEFWQGEVSGIKDKMQELLNDLSAFDKSDMVAAEKSVSDSTVRLNVAENGLSTAEKSHRSIKEELNSSTQKQSRLEQELAEVSDKCPYCKGDLAKAKVTGVKDAIKKKIKAEKDVQTRMKKDLDAQVKVIEALQADVDKLVEEKAAEIKNKNEIEASLKGMFQKEIEYKNLKTQLGDYEARLKEAETSLQREKDAKPPKVDLEGIKKNIKKLELQVEEAEKSVASKEEELSRVSWWVKKGFGSGGLKAFVFNAMLDQLNIYAQRYANRLGFKVEFTVDMTKASKPFQTMVYKGDMVRNYKDLSGGQRQRVDICVAFAMHDLVSHKTNINMLLMDEITENLDAAGMAVCLELVRGKAEDKLVYVITHSSTVDVLNSRSIQINLDEGEHSYLS